MKTTPADNSTFDSYGMTSAEVITLTVVSYFISSIGTMSNILVLFAVLLTRQLRESCTAVLMISLSFCDAIICAVYVPMYIVDIHHDAGTVLEAVRWRVGFAFFMASLNGELIVTFERFVYICYPYRYINWTSTTHVAIAAFCAQWLPSLVLTLPLLVTSTPLYSLVYIAVVTAFISVLHVSIYCVARRESRQIACQYPTGSQTPRMPVWNKSVTAVAMAVMASLLCWAPVVFLPAIVAPTSLSFKYYIKIASAFTSLGAAIHPFIFCWKLRHFREALANCLRKLRNVLCG